MTGIDLETMRAVNRDACAYYSAEPRRGVAVRYLAHRGINAGFLPDCWAFGYAPAGWTGLVDQLRRRFSEEALLDAGVARVCSRGTLIDTFRDRVMFPIHSMDGSIAGFIGRDLSGHALAPKYLNTRQNALFNKSQLLYGLYEGSRQRKVQPVVVEGPLDVLAIAAKAQERGHTDALPVTACGTAFTSHHAQAIADAAHGEGNEVVVAMDGDPAGRAAALAAGEKLREAGQDVRVVMLPTGDDPADYLARPGGTIDAFRSERGLSLVQVHLDDAIAKQGDRMQWVEDRIAVLRTVARYLATYPPEVAARQAGRLAETLDLLPSTVRSEIAEAHLAEMSSLAVGVRLL